MPRRRQLASASTVRLHVDLNLTERETQSGEIQRNPCRNLGRLLAKVKRQQSEEADHVAAWGREEVETLLLVAQDEEPAFHPFLAFLVSTGCRKSEARALKWRDIDWDGRRLHIRRT